MCAKTPFKLLPQVWKNPSLTPSPSNVLKSANLLLCVQHMTLTHKCLHLQIIHGTVIMYTLTAYQYAILDQKPQKQKFPYSH